MNKIIYLDAAASYLKPMAVIDSEINFLTYHYANSGRSVCARAGAVDVMISGARMRVADFINAKSNQIVFTAGATDSLNRVLGILSVSKYLKNNPTVAVSDIDHHSARLCWENLARQKQCDIIKMPLTKEYNLDAENMPCADIYVITAMSNVLGAAQDVSGIVQSVRAINKSAIVIVDAAQYVVHNIIDAEMWGADFICFSAHKLGADTGLGILYIKNPEAFNPDKWGGGMVNKIIAGDSSESADVILNSAPDCFEAGTLPLTQIAGLVPAIDSLEQNRPDLNLIKYLYDSLSLIPRIKIITARSASVLTFVIDDMHVLDFGALMGARNICLRVGNMCATWVHNLLKIDGSIRISVGAYNTASEIDDTIKAIKAIVK